MTIGFDAKRAVANNTGLGNYSRLVLDVLSQQYPDNRYMLYAPDINNTFRLKDLIGRNNISLHGPHGSWRAVSSIWRLTRGITHDIMHDKVNLFHGLSNELPLDIRRAGIASVVTIHDLIFRRQPQGYKPIDREIYDYKFRHAAHASTRIIAISQRTRNDIIELYGIDESKIDVVYQGCNPVFTRPVTEEKLAEVKKRLNLPPRYIVMVGTLEPRKNQLLAVKALPMISSDIKLLIVGRGRMGYDTELMREAHRLGVKERIMHITHLESTDLPAVYSLSAFSAYPSRYEGFGIPVIEAINCGVPVIAATGSCLEEAGGPGAIYVNPDDSEEFARRANTLLENEEECSRMVKAGQEYVKRFNQQSFAKGIMQSYLRALESV